MINSAPIHLHKFVRTHSAGHRRTCLRYTMSSILHYHRYRWEDIPHTLPNHSYRHQKYSWCSRLTQHIHNRQDRDHINL